MKIFLKILIVLLVALCLFPVRVLVYQSLWTYFSVTLGSAKLLVILGIYIIVKKDRIEFSLLGFLVLIWFSYTFIRTLALGGEHYRLYLYLGYACLFIFTTFAVKSRLLCRNDITGIFYVFGLLEALICILQTAGAVKSANGFFAVTGTFENPNITAMFLMACLPFGLFVKQNKGRVLSVAGVMLLSVAIVLLQCRTAYIAALAVFGVFFWQKDKVRNVIKNQKIIASGILLIVILSAVFLYRFKQASADGRMFVWKISTAMIFEKPFLGYGYGLFERNYNLAQARYFQSGKGSETEKQNADHVNMAYNEYNEQTVEGGIIGLFFYCGFLLWALFIAVKSRDFEAFALIVAVIIAGFVNFVIQCMPLCLLLFCYCASLECKTIKYNKIPAILIFVLSAVFIINQSKLLYAQLQLKTVITLEKSGKTAHASYILQKIERNAETSEAFMLQFGRVLMKNYNYDEAFRVLKKASYYSSNIEIFYALSKFYVINHDYLSVEKSLQTIAFMIPTNLKSRYRLMQFYQYFGKTENAEFLANEILEIFPKTVSFESTFYKSEAMKVLGKHKM